MSRFHDLTGKRFGWLVVRERADNDKDGKGRWTCDCDCGQSSVILARHLMSGHSASCGCRHIRHGKAKSPEYKVWRTMIDRCRNPRDRSYANYGGRGIKVCARWFDFANFIADMGERPSADHTLDRFPSNDGNYEPGNCRWATRTEQNRNKRNNRLLTHDGVTATVAEWSELRQIKRSTLSMRLKAGWEVSKALKHA